MRPKTVEAHHGQDDSEFAEFIAESEMDLLGGIRLRTLKAILGGQHPLFESFENELVRLLAQRLLKSHISEPHPFQRWTEIPRDEWMIVTGNLPVGDAPKWWEIWKEQKVETRPDRAILLLAQQGRFKSILLDE